MSKAKAQAEDPGDARFGCRSTSVGDARLDVEVPGDPRFPPRGWSSRLAQVERPAAPGGRGPRRTSSRWMVARKHCQDEAYVVVSWLDPVFEEGSRTKVGARDLNRPRHHQASPLPEEPHGRRQVSAQLEVDYPRSTPGGQLLLEGSLFYCQA
jgi:hypothetical protein